MSFKKNLFSSSIINDGDSLASEAYKAIRTNIIHLLKNTDCNSVLFTSPYANAGKTTTCSNLAITFSNLGKKVLIIDADMRKPTIHKLFSLHSSPGLSNILSGESDAGIIHGTIYPNLSVLTAGHLPDNPSEILHSESFSELLKKLSDEYDLVFIDAPPVDVVTDAVVISQLHVATLLVIRQNSTEKDTLVKTVNALKNVDANILGYVLNAVDYEKFSYRYGHYSGKYGKKNYYYYYTSTLNKEDTE